MLIEPGMAENFFTKTLLYMLMNLVYKIWVYLKAGYYVILLVVILTRKLDDFVLLTM